jgi:outer membrane lipoprotein-sorting protein
MRIKKGIALLVLLLLLIGTLIGCGSAPADDGTEAADPTEEVTSESSDSIDSDYLLGVLAKGAINEGMSYDLTMTAGDQITKASYYMEGMKFKMIGSYGGVESVTIMDGENMVTYDPVQKTGMKIPYTPDDSEMAAGPGLVDADLSDNFDSSALTYREKGEFDGEECLIVTSKDIASTTEVKMWINERLGMVVKMEAASEDGQIFTTELTNIKLGKPVAGTFDVPSDIQLVEIPGM